jgi:hypothetical protein
VLEVAALAVAAWFLALGLSDLLANEVAATLAPTTNSPTAVATVGSAVADPVGSGEHALADGAAILERNIFDSAVGPLAGGGPLGAGGAHRPGEGASGVSRLAIGPCAGAGVRVLATVSSDVDRSGSFAVLGSASSTGYYREGDEFAGRRVADIGWRYVLLADREEALCYLDLHGGDAPLFVAAQPTAAGYRGATEVSRTSRSI